MNNRWSILALLFLVRLMMAFQFQAVAALSPFLVESFALGLADIGLLIGVFLAPGVIVAIPGGAIAARLGDKRVVCAALLMMLAGGVITALSSDWYLLVLSRVLAGVGGVLLNVVSTKMLVDWFAGREIATAMAIFVNSWPIGIALALLVLPPAAEMGGITFAWWIVVAMIAASLVFYAALYRAPAGLQEVSASLKVTKLPTYPLTLAGLIWAFYNTGLAMVFSFGPALFVQKGWDAADAAGIISAFMIFFSLALPIGGLIADRIGARDAVIFTSMLSFVVLIPVVLFGPAALTIPSFLVVAVLFSFAAGPVMTLPSAVLSPEMRAFGMGVFFSIYYGVMMIAPRIAGSLADASGDVSTALLCGVAAALACIAALWLFRRNTV
ncbi:MAG: MFS transporter [Paracoccaceae bacterium]|uniref:MFS transporter n=1 Tax=Sulfitobacter pontiacus TaxID=60137 RepID=UPI0032863C6C